MSVTPEFLIEIGFIDRTEEYGLDLYIYEDDIVVYYCDSLFIPWISHATEVVEELKQEYGERVYNGCEITIKDLLKKMQVRQWERGYNEGYNEGFEIASGLGRV